MLGNDIAKPSSSSWASPCLLVPKSDNTPRFCSDFHKVMGDSIDQVGSANYVSRFDLLKGYWQVPLSERA